VQLSCPHADCVFPVPSRLPSSRKQSNNAEKAAWSEVASGEEVDGEREREREKGGRRKLVALGPLSMLRDWFTTT
jgi:hypothetical protein